MTVAEASDKSSSSIPAPSFCQYRGELRICVRLSSKSRFQKSKARVSELRHPSGTPRTWRTPKLDHWRSLWRICHDKERTPAIKIIRPNELVRTFRPVRILLKPSRKVIGLMSWAWRLDSTRPTSAGDVADHSASSQGRGRRISWTTMTAAWPNIVACVESRRKAAKAARRVASAVIQTFHHSSGVAVGGLTNVLRDAWPAELVPQGGVSRPACPTRELPRRIKVRVVGK